MAIFFCLVPSANTHPFFALAASRQLASTGGSGVLHPFALAIDRLLPIVDVSAGDLGVVRYLVIGFQFRAAQ